ncbi:DUF6241 domain-containing protein [Sporolactobacillus sp. Y61]|uniref:DUF6241 domain-containing protein n=1 Tax=Sporolactobacillus sp. Y61 TaxID=3160863 RepID=A0AAU8IHH2_9BACL|nr:DUF6241 domain-containing protein [Sporolactobacillus sp. THM19-2]RYL94197.1 hypothetical protein EWH91_03385 [Sporolactobacillus sp. THM19-2]
MTIKRILLIAIGSLLMIGLLVVAGYIFFQKQQTNEVRHQVTQKMLEEINAADPDDKTNPFGENKVINDLTDEDMQMLIHEMSHQKIKADQKWGFIQITKARINWLQEALGQNEFINEAVYQEIVTRWEKGDFSRADKDHNAIWELQGGTVGKAEGLLTKQEEKDYVASQLKKK